MSRRTTLIRTIDFIYPIEPLSSGDLLFTILDVPLPLPNGPSEPAPPTSLAGHPSVNENAVASALGYAAHVVILIATYLGRLLPYPISYAASRSLIRDPISAMQGPRVYVFLVPVPSNFLICNRVWFLPRLSLMRQAASFRSLIVVAP